jgi:hypothetical protein
MLEKICERCDQTMRLIPAGISKKSGKPYNAFWTCDKRNGGCGETARAEGEAAQAAPTPGQASFGGGGVRPASNEQLNRIEEKLDQILSIIKG